MPSQSRLSFYTRVVNNAYPRQAVLKHWWGDLNNNSQHKKPDGEARKWMVALHMEGKRLGLSPLQLKEILEHGAVQEIWRRLAVQEEARVRVEDGVPARVGTQE